MAIEVKFPDPQYADDDGLVAVGGEISEEFLIAAYTQGLFPWYNPGEPILWWSPNPRMILIPSEFKVSKSLRQTINSKKYEVRSDTCFAEVINACANTGRPGQKGTWISQEIIKGYTGLHQKGLAHSVETFFEGQLVGGLYGVSLGNAFFGESMFHTKSDASKIALYHLCRQLTVWGFDFIDVQQSTSHLRSLGGEDIPRENFLEQLNATMKKPTRKGLWILEY